MINDLSPPKRGRPIAARPDGTLPYPPRVWQAIHEDRGSNLSAVAKIAGEKQNTLLGIIRGDSREGGAISKWEKMADAISSIPLLNGTKQVVTVSWLRGRDEPGSMCALHTVGEVGGRAKMEGESSYSLAGYVALICTDDSLAPFVRRGDKILISKELPKTGDLVAFVHEGSWVVREYRTAEAGHLFLTIGRDSDRFPPIVLKRLPPDLHRVRGCLK